MDIVRSLELESFILTKLTKPFVPVNLVGPQVSLPPRWVPASRGSIHFLCIIRRHFWWVRADSGGNVFSRNTVARPVGPSSQGETIFSQNTGGPSGGSPVSGGGIIILHVIRRHFLACKDSWWVRPVSGGHIFSQNTKALPVGPSCQVEESLFCA